MYIFGIGLLIIILLVGLFEKWLYQFILKINNFICPKTESETEKLFIYSVILFFGIFIPMFLMVVILFSIFQS